MSIPKLEYEKIIQSLRVGNPVAEFDTLLEQARVETPIFHDILDDKYDIISGQKGSGKTAIFKILQIISNSLLIERNLVIIKGVNTTGDSIFNKFRGDFSKFSEDDFENFWKLYFITLIYNNFINDQTFKASLSGHLKEINEFKDKCREAGIPDIPAKQDKADLIAWVINLFPKIKKVKIPLSTEIPNLFTEIEFDDQTQIDDQKDEKCSIYVNKIGESLKVILQRSGYKIWIILDRLDEVFERYSSIEFNGLRGLLKAYKSFDLSQGGSEFRIKIFLRNDIKLFLTDIKTAQEYLGKRHVSPLTALTHIAAKESPTLKWSEEEIESLILNRLLIVNDNLKEYLGCKGKDAKKIKQELRHKDIKLHYWNMIFPKKISSTSSLKWIYNRLKDANNIVTPRSVIDLLEGAISYQRQHIVVDLKDFNEIIPVEAIKSGLDIASKNKLENDIYNEFPKEKPYMEKLREKGKHKLTQKEIERIYGANWPEISKKLAKIGVIRYLKDSDSYSIAYLYRPALEITYSH